MLVRLAVWYKSLTPWKQLAVSFLAHWLFWFLAVLLGDRILYSAQHSLAYHLARATWMACFTTIAFDWKKAKGLFRRKQAGRATASKIN